MIHDTIDEVIKAAMKQNDQVKLSVFRALKSAFSAHLTAKHATPLTDAIESSIIKKMHTERLESAAIYEAANRTDLSTTEYAEAEILAALIPAEATDEEIQNALIDACIEKGLASNTEGISIPKKEMGVIIKLIKEKLPNADGKKISDLVKLYVC